jgi:ABC-type bacteriocin/lantibiotic exporter with double-glycine peptidase domain
VRFLASLIWSSPVLTFVYSPLLVVQTLVGVVVPFAMGAFIDRLVGGERASAVTPFAVLAALLLGRAVLTPCLSRLVLVCSRKAELRLQNEVLDTVLKFSPGEISQRSDGSLVAKLTRDVSAVGGFVSGLYPRVLVALVTMLATGVSLCSRSVTLALAFVAFVPLCILFFLPFARQFATTSHAVRTRSDGAFSTLFDFLHSLPFLRTLDAERRFVAEPCASLKSLKDGNCAMDRVSVAFGGLLGGVLVVGEVIVLGVAGSLAARGAIPVGDVVVYQMLFLAAMQSVQGIVSLLPETAALREGVASLREVLSRTLSPSGDHPLPAIKTLEFRDVSFAYPRLGTDPLSCADGASRPVGTGPSEMGPVPNETDVNSLISGFSAIFRVGRVVALVGANGAGKTTLLKLATGALKPQEGQILVNDEPLADFDAHAFRRKIGIVFQESLLVTGTVRDNITLRDVAFSGADIADAMARSGFAEVARRLPNGLDTRLGLGGQTLSGGELQRLAIARALIRKPDILVLDEVTNHLDADARAAFGRLLRSLAPGRIVLVVSHDPAIIALCDESIGA